MKYRVQQCINQSEYFRIQKRVFGIWFNTYTSGEIAILDNVFALYTSVEAAEQQIKRFKKVPAPEPKWRTVK